MAQAAAQQPASAAPEQKKSGKLLIIVAAVVALAIAGGATWFFLGKKSDHSEPAPVKESAPVFYPLETFTVNLVPEFGDQYLQVEMTLKVADQDIVDRIKSRMPEVRNRMILLLSSKRASELTNVYGKNALAESVRSEINGLLEPAPKKSTEKLKHTETQDDAHGTPSEGSAAGEHGNGGDTTTGPVREVLFTSFIIQ